MVYNTSGLHFLTSSAILAPNVRTHVALKYNGGIWTIYMNGVAYSVTGSATPVIAQDAIELGYDNVSPYTFNGYMSNAVYWRTGRTTAAIAIDKNSCDLSNPAISGYWPLNEGTDYFANDQSGYGNTLYFTDYVNMWANAPTGLTTNTYTWSFGDSGTGTGTSIAHTYTAAGVYTTSVIVTNGFGCSTPASNTVSVNVAPALTSATVAAACTGGTLSLFANTPSNVTGYSWAGPNGFNDVTQNPSISGITTAASGTYTVTVYNGGAGCNTSYMTTTTVNVAPTITQAVAPSLACIGGNLTLVADTPANVTGYLWTGPNSFSATSASPSLSGLTTAASGVYSVTVNNGAGSGCTASYTTVPVQVITVPVIGVIGGVTSTCAGNGDCTE